MAELPPLPGPVDRLDEEAATWILRRASLEPAAGIVLGSGLSNAVAGLEEEVSFAYHELPGFPRPTVPGHAGRLVLGRLAGVPVAVFLGRAHFYEGHPMDVSSLPVRVARLLGAETMIVTAAVGGIDPALSAGTLVLGTDQINLMGVNPLRGWRMPDGSPAFVDVSAIYDRELTELAADRAEGLGIRVARGVYVAMPGPSYETPAEIEFLRRIGGTVVGMSVVPETVPATAVGMRVLGLFSVTNVAGVHVGHEEVVAVSNAMADALGRLLEELLPPIAEPIAGPIAEEGA